MMCVPFGACLYTAGLAFLPGECGAGLLDDNNLQLVNGSWDAVLSALRFLVLMKWVFVRVTKPARGS